MDYASVNENLLLDVCRANGIRVYQHDMPADLLRRTMFKSEEIFSGQEAEGFVVFPALHPDVSGVGVEVNDIVLRFDFRNEPVETTNLNYEFVRDVGKIYNDGTVKLSQAVK